MHCCSCSGDEHKQTKPTGTPLENRQHLCCAASLLTTLCSHYVERTNLEQVRFTFKRMYNHTPLCIKGRDVCFLIASTFFREFFSLSKVRVEVRAVCCTNCKTRPDIMCVKLYYFICCLIYPFFNCNKTNNNTIKPVERLYRLSGKKI